MNEQTDKEAAEKNARLVLGFDGPGVTAVNVYNLAVECFLAGVEYANKVKPQTNCKEPPRGI